MADTGPDLELIGASEGGGSGGGGGGGGGLPTLDGTCATGPTACSESDGPSTTVELVNLSDRTVDLLWIDARCGRTLYQSAAPGSTIQQQSYSQHVWAIVDQASGTELGRVLAAEAPPCTVTVQ